MGGEGGKGSWGVVLWGGEEEGENGWRRKIKKIVSVSK